jgi:hypothetical protein
MLRLSTTMIMKLTAIHHAMYHKVATSPVNVNKKLNASMTEDQRITISALLLRIASRVASMSGGAGN